MDVVAIVRIRLNNWCDPEDVEANETLVSVTQALLESEQILGDVDEFEVLDATFTSGITRDELDEAREIINKEMR